MPLRPTVGNIVGLITQLSGRYRMSVSDTHLGQPVGRQMEGEMARERERERAVAIKEGRVSERERERKREVAVSGGRSGQGRPPRPPRAYSVQISQSGPESGPGSSRCQVRVIEFHLQTLTIFKLGFNQIYCTSTSIVLIKIVLCSTIP
jgi:hypothetical protein